LLNYTFYSAEYWSPATGTPIRINKSAKRKRAPQANSLKRETDISYQDVFDIDRKESAYCRDIVALFSSHPFRNSPKDFNKPSTIGFGEILSRALFI